MPFSVFVAMISSTRIHFTRVDQFDDHFEGNWPKPDLQYWIEKKADVVPSVTYSLKQRIAASCWIELDYESAGMWRLYVPDGKGIAITTTYQKLQNLMESHKGAKGIDIADAARVRYVDHFRESLIKELKGNQHLPGAFVPFMLKNISYEHEREVRALVCADINNNIDESGCDLRVDLSNFIEKIVVAPTAPNWFANTILEVCRKFELDRALFRSDLSRESFYATVSERRRDRAEE